MKPLKNKISERILEDMIHNRNAAKRVLIYEACPQCRRQLEKRSVNIISRLPAFKCIAARVLVSQIPILASMGVISYIEPDSAVKIALDEAGKTVGAQAFRSNDKNGTGINIAVIDTGIYPHNDFTKPDNRILEFVDLINDSKEPYDDNGHGTFCAGCAVGNGYESKGKYTGIAPGANVIMVKAVDAQGSGRVSDILRAMQWVFDNADSYNIRVLSLSLGVEVKDKKDGSDILSKAAKLLWDRGITVLAAAGNSGPKDGTIDSPGICPDIITVGAMNDRAGRRQVASFSSRGGEGDNKPDIVAPGVNITAPFTGGGYTVMSGTSMAAPIAAGCAALLLASDKGLTPDSVKRKLMDSASALLEPSNAQGKGVINLKE